MSHAPSEFLSRRHDRIRRALAERQLDALVVTSLPNVLYLTNFTGSAAIVLLTRERLVFVTDFRYVAAIEAARNTPHECPGLELSVVDSSYDATLATLIKSLSSARVGFEATDLPVSRHNFLCNAIASGPQAPDLVATEGLVQRARAVKDRYELDVFTEAA